MKKSKFKLLIMAGILTVGSLASTGVFAASNERLAMSYNEDVPGFNGMVSKQGGKYYNGGTGYVKSTSIGGNYKLDTRLHQKTSTSWKRIDDNTQVSWSISSYTGSSMSNAIYLHLSTDLITPVTVNAYGTWDAN